MLKSRGLIFCTLLLAAALPALALPINPVAAGVDFWQTLSAGATAYDFSTDPIPAGFFCKNSRAFTGVVYFEGVPLQSEPAGILGTTDTIIERLDDAVFDRNGVAKTRIRGRALNLVGTKPLKSSCGRFKVTAELTEDQPESTMIFHYVDKDGGTFEAQLRLRVRLNFTSLANGKVISLVRNVYLPTVHDIPYAVKATATQACQQVPASFETASITLADGKPLITREPAATPGKAAASPGTFEPGQAEPHPAEPQPVVTGCYCQNGRCMQTYSWHDPCAGITYDKCEKHFTHTPCELGYRDQCASDTTAGSFADQLGTLEERGYLNEKPEVVLQKQLRSAEEIKRDQAARDRAERQQQ